MDNLHLFKGIAQNIANLFLDESRKNVTFVFKNAVEKIKAHKCILEAASPVFKAMFSGNFTELDEVEIDDISPEVFKLFLSAIYLNDIASQLDKIEDPLEIYADLYYAAEKYDIKDIRELSKNYMLDNCHDENTNWLLNKAKIFNLPDLEAKCKKCFQEFTYDMLASHIYLDLNGGYLHEFLDLENIAVKTEFDLYMALQVMVDNKSLLDYSKCLSQIRFLTMETTDILSCELLSDSEKIAVISNIEGKKVRSMPAHLSCEKKPRILSFVHSLFKKKYFWDAIMLKSVKYEDYFEDFFKQMEILAGSREERKTKIIEGRKEICVKLKIDYI